MTSAKLSLSFTKASFRLDRVERLLALNDFKLDGSVELMLSRDFVVPETTGVYLVHDLRGVLYVGRSSNLRRRFTQHDRLRRNRLLRVAMAHPVGVLSFSWSLTPQANDSAALERHLISHFQPVCNRLLLDTPLT